jgi:drug/metabolite transporter (DMT)-like permease
MNGALLAAASGVGFGLAQITNARALSGIEDPFASTLVQIVVAALALTVLSLGTGELLDALDAPLWALGDFAIAGVLHFLAGWSFFNLSQRRIGAARTSPLLTTVPLFGVVIAAVTIGQLPGPLALAAIGLMCAGAWVVAMRGGLKAPRIADAVPGLGCAFLWALSPIFIVRGLDGLGSPLAGITIGLLVAVAACVPAYALWRGGERAWQAVGTAVVWPKLLAGVLVAISTWWRWAAFEDATVGAVLALSLLSVPVVLLLGPVIAGRHVERVTAELWGGAGLVLTGALILMVT